MESRISTRRVVVSVAIGVALATAMASAASAATERRSADTILIGSIAGTTGAYGSTGVAMVNGAKLAVADLNAKGGALGKKFSLQSFNDQASATLSSQLYNRLVSAGAVAVQTDKTLTLSGVLATAAASTLTPSFTITATGVFSSCETIPRNSCRAAICACCRSTSRWRTRSSPCSSSSPTRAATSSRNESSPSTQARASVAA